MQLSLSVHQYNSKIKIELSKKPLKYPRSKCTPYQNVNARGECFLGNISGKVCVNVAVIFCLNTLDSFHLINTGFPMKNDVPNFRQRLVFLLAF